MLTGDASALAPEVLPHEIGNALSAMVKRRLTTPTDRVKRVAAGIGITLLECT